jgi:hypothetical protein
MNSTVSLYLNSPCLLFGHVEYCSHDWGQQFFRNPFQSLPYPFNQSISGWRFVFTNTGLGFYHFPALGIKSRFGEASIAQTEAEHPNNQGVSLSNSGL